MCDVVVQGLAAFQVTREKKMLVPVLPDGLRVLTFNVGRKTRRYERSMYYCDVRFDIGNLSGVVF